MIKNYSHGFSNVLITYDDRLSEIRIVKDQEIKFIKLSITENNILSFCNDDKKFKILLRDILKENGFLCSLSLLKRKYLNSSGVN